MVGNDVVDLRDRDASPRTLSRRFDERVFCPEERDTLEWSRDRRWSLWAAKEAAYKVAVKQDPATIFSPSRFRVRLAAGEPEACTGTGIVTWDSGSVKVDVCVEDGAVHAVATTTANRLVVGLRRLEPALAAGPDPKTLSDAVRRLASRRLAVALRVAADSIEIRKADRVPELLIGGARAPADLSFSHHGEVVAFACEIFEARRGVTREPSPALESAP